MSDEKKRGQTNNAEDERSVESLLQSMREKADAERDRIRRDAEDEKSKILDNADREIERLKAEAIQQVDREVDVAIAGKMGRTRMEAQAGRVKAKNSNLEAVFSHAREQLDSISGERYERVLKQLISEAQVFISEGGSIHVRKDDLDMAKKALADLGSEWKVQGIDGDRGTVIITNGTGTRRVDNSFIMRLKRAELALRDDVSRVLFGSESESSA